MKTFFLLLWAAALLGSNGAQAQNRTIKHLVGRWEVVDSNNDRGELEVVDTTKIFLAFGNEKKTIVSFKADFSKTPCWFDFSFQNGTQTVTLRSLLQFISDDLVQWQVFDGDQRPAHFTRDTGEMVYLRRQTQAR